MESGGKLKCNVVEVVLSEIRLGINVGFIAGYFDLTIYGMNFFFKFWRQIQFKKAIQHVLEIYFDAGILFVFLSWFAFYL